jgi:predicted enzyme related to lactoylglutathione lyase
MPAAINCVTWFEIPAVDLARATRFYEAAFGWKLDPQQIGDYQMAWFPMAENAYGAAGALVHGELAKPSTDGTLVYLGVPAIDAALASIESAGGKTLVPRTPIGPHGFIAEFEDSEGNRVALHESLPKA